MDFLVDGYRLGRAVLTDCLFEEAPGSNLVPLVWHVQATAVGQSLHGAVFRRIAPPAGCQRR